MKAEDLTELELDIPCSLPASAFRLFSLPLGAINRKPQTYHQPITQPDSKNLVNKSIGTICESVACRYNGGNVNTGATALRVP